AAFRPQILVARLQTVGRRSLIAGDAVNLRSLAADPPAADLQSLLGADRRAGLLAADHRSLLAADRRAVGLLAADRRSLLAADLRAGLLAADRRSLLAADLRAGLLA